MQRSRSLEPISRGLPLNWDRINSGVRTLTPDLNRPDHIRQACRDRSGAVRMLSASAHLAARYREEPLCAPLINHSVHL